MILVVTLNPALDVTYHVPGVDWDGVNRPAGTRARAGGKGLNVARTLLTIGALVQVTGLAGGVTGEQVVSALGALGVPASFTRIGGETRRTFAVVDTARGGTALFNEPGPAVGEDEYAEFCVGYEKALAGCSAVILSGSPRRRFCFRSRSDERILEQTRAHGKAASGRSSCWPSDHDGRFTSMHASPASRVTWPVRCPPLRAEPGRSP